MRKSINDVRHLDTTTNQFYTFPPPPTHFPPTPSSSISSDSFGHYYDLTPSHPTPAPVPVRRIPALGMNPDYPYQAPSIRIQQSTPIPHFEQSSYIDSQPSFYQHNPYTVPQDWQMYQNSDNTGGGVSTLYTTDLSTRSRGHQRTSSDSTVGSTGPASPYSQNTSYPYIANTDRSPTSPLHYSSHLSDEASTRFPKSLPTQTPNIDSRNSMAGHMPSQLSHTSSAHAAMKNMAIDHHNNVEDAPEFGHSSRQSVSSCGRDSPSTPGEDHDEKLFKVPTNGEKTRKTADTHTSLPIHVITEYRTTAPRVELFRTESAACADELYNPANFTSSSPSSSQVQQPISNSNLLSPHRDLVSQRLRAANDVRSQSPVQPASRDRSPFRQGSPLAPADGYKSPGPIIGTAAHQRQQQKQEADALAFARHQPQLRREPTKTISPKDAMLDYNEADDDTNFSLFQDTVPMGYQKNYGGTETFSNNFISGTNQAFGNMANFRATDGTSASNFNFSPPSVPGQTPANPYASQSYRSAAGYSNAPEQTPEFPAHLMSMESSISEGAAAPSSQGSANSAPIQRPPNTQADTGTYTCTYHGCTQRFESPVKLQKHKREAHRQPRDTYSSPTTAETSPNSASASPDTEVVGSGMTSSALLARNSQAGPHKCTRINPSTGKPCDTIFSRPYDLTRHEDTIHNRGKQKVRCQYCREEKTFSRNDALTRHMRVVHPEIDFQGKRGKKHDY
ncbi:hypothetical protein H2203_008029 [Taxawa tesnikishii (nom. ined.)]|nr:hypothetical protein H2203_008029 [Dothideales sp. JES 119]